MTIDDTRFHLVWTSKHFEDVLISSHAIHQDALDACDLAISQGKGSGDPLNRIGHYRISTSHAFN